MLIVIGAFKIELDNLIRSSRIGKKTREDGAAFYWGDLEGKNVLFIITGMGKKNAEKAVEILFRQKESAVYRDARILITGFCGAAAGDLEAGDPVTYKKVVDLTDCRKTNENYSQTVLRSHIFSADKVTGIQKDTIRPVVCGCTDHVATTPEEKDYLFKKYDIDVIDMESYWLIEGLLRNGLLLDQISCIRVVSDDANGKLPLYFSADTFGRTILYILKSLFISIYSREELRTNIHALKNIKKAKLKLDKKILGYMGLSG